jgi:hypothetical protein
MPTIQEYIEHRSSYDPLDPTVAALIAMAEVEIGHCYCNDDMRNKAIALLVMHWLVIQESGSQESGVTGSVKSQKEGDLAQSWGTNSNKTGDPFLSQTSYGLELQMLNKQCFVLPRNRFTNGC